MNMFGKFLRGFVYAFAGWATAFRTQRNFRIHLFVALLVIGAGYYFGITPTEWCLVLTCIGTVLGAELVNSAIEAMIDLLHPDRHPLAGRAKDLAAGAVLIVVVTSVIIGLIIFLPYLGLVA
jgi:diacylglycerol kinase